MKVTEEYIASCLDIWKYSKTMLIDSLKWYFIRQYQGHTQIVELKANGINKS